MLKGEPLELRVKASFRVLMPMFFLNTPHPWPSIIDSTRAWNTKFQIPKVMHDELKKINPQNCVDQIKPFTIPLNSLRAYDYKKKTLIT